MKKLIPILLTLTLLFSLSLASACAKSEDASGTETEAETSGSEITATEIPEGYVEGETITVDEDIPTDWAVYIYLCGGSAETDGGSATEDLYEILSATIPSNVKVVIESGGTEEWTNTAFSAEKVQRWVIDEGGMEFIEDADSASMGTSESLASFLEFADEECAPAHKVVILWDRSGGTADSVCQDAVYDDSLTLDEIREAFDSVYGLSDGTCPVDVLGFDSSIMTEDNANTLSGISAYIAGYQDSAPESGWNYTDFINMLGQNTDADAETVGNMITSTCSVSSEESPSEISVIQAK